jgi:hypothetical protein
MRRKSALWLIIAMGVLFTTGVASAQGDSGASRDKLIERLEELQKQTLTILGKAQLNNDLNTALEAVSEARATAELIAVLTGRLPVAQKPAATPAGAPVVYLIAFKDQVIRAALAYSVEGNMLQYTTLQGKQEHAPLDSVDRELSEQLNRERNVEFRLPAK